MGTTPRSVTAGDFNGDGIVDLVSADYIDSRVSLLLGNGDGTFRTRTSFQVGNAPSSVQTGDFNGDGLLDLVIAEYGVGSVGILIGNGNATFQAKMTFQVGSGPYSVQTGDFDGDGVVDLVTADYVDSRLHVLLGETRDGTAPLLPFSLKSLAGARQALPIFTRKIEQLAKQRGEIGAFLSRIEVGINNLQSASENFAAAESRIRDADVAAEAANLTRLSILQQAASSILAQANQQPALTLQLLNT